MTLARNVSIGFDCAAVRHAMKKLILAILFKYKINNITLIAIQLPDLSFVALNY